MDANLLQELTKDKIFLGSVNGHDCQIFIGDTLRFKKRKGVFVDIALLEGNQESIQTRIEKIRFFPDETKDAEAKKLLIAKVTPLAKTKKKSFSS